MYNRTCNRKSPIAITIQSQIANRKSRDRTDAKKCVGGLAGLHFWTPMIDDTRRSYRVLPGACGVLRAYDSRIIILLL